jgi:DNA-directed RNA polymerase specialized sigma24 family protein
VMAQSPRRPPMTDPDSNEPNRDQRFHHFYTEHFRDVSGFVRRRVGASDSSDVIAQVFAVAWRRFEDIPVPPADRLWLLGVARRTVASHRRSGSRRFQLHQRLFEQLRPISSHHDVDHVLARVETALARLRPKEP